MLRTASPESNPLPSPHMDTLNRPKTLAELSQQFLPTMADRGIDRKSLNVLVHVFENWLLGDGGKSSSHIRSQFFSSRDCLERLTRRLVREENKRFSLSFEAYAILLVHRKKCATQLKAAMDWTFKAAGQRLKADADQTMTTVNEFLVGAPSVVTREGFIHALQLLSTGSLGIHAGRDQNDEPVVSHTLDVRQFPNTLAAVSYFLKLTADGPMRPPELVLSTFSLELLAIAPEVHANAARALERAQHDPGGAITSARAALEATFKWIAHEHQVDVGKNPTLQDLLAVCRAPLGLDSVITVDMMRAVATLSQRIFEIRNKFGDAHALSPTAGKASRSEARYVTSSSLLLAAYLLERFEAKSTI